MISSKRLFLDEVDSTNRYLSELVSKEKVPEGTMVVARFQTAGKGMDGNRWESAPGLNLTFSFVIYPDFLPVDQQFYLNKSISLALADLAEEMLGENNAVKIKWPNDLYAGNNKLAGMLVQNGVKGNRFDFAVVGIGLNVNQVTFSESAPNPVSFRQLTGREYDLEEVLNKTVVCIEHRLEMLKSGNRQQLDADYIKLLYRFGSVETFIFKDKEIRAKIRGVNRYGQLILEIPGEKILECDMKEVKFLI